MTAITNTQNLRQYKSRFSLIVKVSGFSFRQSLREVKYKSPDFTQIAWRCFELLNVPIRIAGSLLSLNLKQYQQNLTLK